MQSVRLVAAHGLGLVSSACVRNINDSVCETNPHFEMHILGH